MIISEHRYGNLGYVLSVPDGFDETGKYPTILFLHGAGTRGDDLSLLAENAYFKLTPAHEDLGFITFAPQCHADTWFDLFETLGNFVRFVSEMSFVDSDRLYFVGNSMGGYAAWQLAMSLPELTAAVVPICGGGMYWNAERLKNVPVWAFHGGKDTTVLVRESEILTERVNACGGKARLTVYPDNGHDAWTDTFKNREVFEWLLSNRKAGAEAVRTEFNDSKIYG